MLPAAARRAGPNDEAFGSIRLCRRRHAARVRERPRRAHGPVDPRSAHEHRPQRPRARQRFVRRGPATAHRSRSRGLAPCRRCGESRRLPRRGKTSAAGELGGRLGARCVRRVCACFRTRIVREGLNRSCCTRSRARRGLSRCCFRGTPWAPAKRRSGLVAECSTGVCHEGKLWVVAGTADGGAIGPLTSCRCLPESPSWKALPPHRYQTARGCAASGGRQPAEAVARSISPGWHTRAGARRVHAGSPSTRARSRTRSDIIVERAHPRRPGHRDDLHAGVWSNARTHGYAGPSCARALDVATARISANWLASASPA